MGLFFISKLSLNRGNMIIYVSYAIVYNYFIHVSMQTIFWDDRVLKGVYLSYLSGCDEAQVAGLKELYQKSR